MFTLQYNHEKISSLVNLCQLSSRMSQKLFKAIEGRTGFVHQIRYMTFAYPPITGKESIYRILPRICS